MQGDPFIIAEIAQGYEGSEKFVQLYVRSASAVGADAIKFQIFYADESAFPDYKFYDLYKSLELPTEVWQQAVDEAHKRGLAFFSDVVGVKSFQMLESIGVDGYKIHTGSIKNIPLIKVVAQAAASSKKRIFLSTGGCEKEEIDQVLKILEGCDVTLMHGFQAEPTEIVDNHLRRITAFKQLYKVPIGFMDHTAGESDLAFYVSFLALGLGATVIEKHLTLSRKAEIEDYISALTPEEFVVWAKRVREAYPALGKAEWTLTEKELMYKQKLKRAICSSRDIKKGEILREEDLILKRTSRPEFIADVAVVAGKEAVRLIPADSIINKEDLL